MFTCLYACGLIIIMNILCDVHNNDAGIYFYMLWSVKLFLVK